MVIADGATPYPVMPAQLDALPRHKSKGKGVTLRIDNTGNQPDHPKATLCLPAATA